MNIRCDKYVKTRRCSKRTSTNKSVWVHKSARRNGWIHLQSLHNLTSNKCRLYSKMFLAVKLDNLIIISFTLTSSLFCIGIRIYLVHHMHFANSGNLRSQMLLLHSWPLEVQVTVIYVTFILTRQFSHVKQ